VIWFLAGFSMGAVVALLLAPKSGEETRDFIGKKAEEGRDYVTAKGKEFRKAAEDLVDKGKDLVAKIPV
ncbi:MAG TPA: YtxH domain-containing protein, partial [Terriglobia bacterium]|nr:YtxH domain-containing protein [Terriglobia bacterium]